MNIYFKTIGQKVSDSKLVLISVVPCDIFGEVPSIFEVQSIRTTPTVYTGTYPTIRINTDTIIDVTDEFKGLGLNGIATTAQWYIQKEKDKNLFGINL